VLVSTAMSMKIIRAAKLLVPLAGVAMAVAACSGGNTGSTSAGATASGFAASDNEPISLVQRRSVDFGERVAMALPEADVKKAVDRYRINKGVSESPYASAGADLDGDGRPEALIYLTGPEWCRSTGCTLLVLKQGDRGYRPVSVTERAQAPVVVAFTASNGWRDLFVRSGGAGMKLQTAQLKFNGSGYPSNASIVPPYLGEAQVNGETIIGPQAPARAAGSSVGGAASSTVQ